MSAAGDVRLYMVLQKAAHAFKKHADAALMAAADLTTAQSAVLVVINSKQEATQRSVADALGLNESAVTAMARKLMSRGLIERRRSETDARAWSLRLTSEGKSALAEVADPFSGLNNKVDEALGSEEVIVLGKLLSTLTEALQADGA